MVSLSKWELLSTLKDFAKTELALNGKKDSKTVYPSENIQLNRPMDTFMFGFMRWRNIKTSPNTTTSVSKILQRNSNSEEEQSTTSCVISKIFQKMELTFCTSDTFTLKSFPKSTGSRFHGKQNGNEAMIQTCKRCSNTKKTTSDNISKKFTETM